ncbi:hypothetical protein [Spirilliplanes yamanashiensis]|uniref:Uncharacterized protein n=1 Tax=Spirilliplanes yamanashiensis TaxID=42233 RepID=A0A8J3Y683_9ACTN|nr:hypothetical protein [Spirilliplanes yamanashiensis]MDP9814545.1 hypothetical protein [Spirilliplanes yamanashiensis]GIJ02197.1 hypothetical protein Sya03_15490 [Spirilliplanes yamanashiensis]
MGSPGGNGGNRPPDGPVPDGPTPDDLPELPPEWRELVVPDDASALAAEAAAVRAELQARRPPAGRRRPALRAPVLIMAIAVVVTLASLGSLFVAGWPGISRPATVQRPTGSPAGRLPALDLLTADGQVVALTKLLPAVIVLVDGCRCDDLVRSATAAVRPGTTVVTVTGRAPSAAPSAPAAPAAQQPPGPTTAAGAPATHTPVVPPAGAAPAARALIDPAGELRQSFRLPSPDGTASVLLVDRDGGIVRTVPRTASIDDFRPDLARL